MIFPGSTSDTGPFCIEMKAIQEKTFTGFVNVIAEQFAVLRVQVFAVASPFLVDVKKTRKHPYEQKQELKIYLGDALGIGLLLSRIYLINQHQNEVHDGYANVTVVA